jgi:uridylate kinase
MQKESSSSYIVCSLGGSLVVPKSGFDDVFVKGFINLVKERVAQGTRFIIIVGGGSTCRNYQEASGRVRPLSNTDLDWIGIHTTHLHAHIIRLLFAELAHTEIISDPTVAIETDAPVIVGGGWKPGWSTDYDAVLLAERFGANRVINLSNIEHVYSADPRIVPDAEKFTDLSWEQYRALLPAEWSPGLSTPFDPIASAHAEKSGISVSICGGGSLDNIARCIDGKDFVGTIIRP